MEGKREILLWLKYKFFKEGISPREFMKNKMSDIKDIIDLDNAIEEKSRREQEIHNLMNRSKMRW